MCITTGYLKQQSFGVACTKTAEHCRQHAPYGMVNVYRNRRTEDSRTISAFKVADTKTDEQCAQRKGQNAVSKDAEEDKLAQTTPERKPLVTQVRVAQSTKRSIPLPPRQALYRVIDGDLVSECNAHIMCLRL